MSAAPLRGEGNAAINLIKLNFYLNKLCKLLNLI
ncbi:hypothetical protein NF27_DP02190 [Candidatus Jidaibacter acanthamoeba]|uniref:Uncharacterized protein n=1 Tax=Candidatus Jidaibacter acanthamoebae TaxID=86105 RepID=A0A0C1R052_9RICK|nr:hypothetical protein NF27_DP02190 [Candidatus Jidaibacter acanthamoeba]